MRERAARSGETVTDLASRLHWEQYRRMYSSPLSAHSPYSPHSLSGDYFLLILKSYVYLLCLLFESELP